MKIIITILSIVLLQHSALGQYTFNSTTTNTYQNLDSAISLNVNIPWNNHFSFPLNYNFDFVLDSQSYTSCHVMAGGGLVFLGAENKELYVFHIPAEGYLLTDRGDTTSFSPINYEITGDTGTHILKVEWRNAGFLQTGSTANPNDSVNFQIWLHEATNCIDVHFGPSSASSSSYVGTGGMAFKWFYDNCLSIMGLQGAADNPSSLFYNGCLPNFHYLTGHPSDAVRFSICPEAVSVKEIQLAEQLDIYPNPASRMLNIDNIPPNFELQSIELSNTLGQLVQQLNYSPISRSSIQITLPEQAKGLHFLSIKGANNIVLTKKIFVN